jgi:hypothetical protein
MPSLEVAEMLELTSSFPKWPVRGAIPTTVIHATAAAVLSESSNSCKCLLLCRPFEREPIVAHRTKEGKPIVNDAHANNIEVP